MKKNKIILLFFALFFFRLPVVVAKTFEIHNLKDLKQYILENNLDIKMLSEKLTKQLASYKNTFGIYTQPYLSGSFAYQDNRQEPTNPFQSARYDTVSWDVDIFQNTPFGIDFNFGLGNDWNKYYQSEPVNPALPYPQSFFQPYAYSKVNIDLVQNFLGYTSRRELQNKKINVKVQKIEKKISLRKIYSMVLSYLVEWHAIDEYLKLTKNSLNQFVKVKKDLENKYSKNLVERSDLYKIKSLVFSTKTDIFKLEKQKAQIEMNIKSILNLDEKTDIVSDLGLHKIYKYSNTCENRFLKKEFSEFSTREIQMERLLLKQSHNEADLYKIKSLPNVKLSGSVHSTGTENTFSQGISEVKSFNRPIYNVGVNFSWPLSLSRNKASRLASSSTRKIADLKLKKKLHEKKLSWINYKKQIKEFSKEFSAILTSENYERKKQKSIAEQYEQGRISLFNLTEEELNKLQLQSSVLQTKVSKVGMVLNVLSDFDAFECELTK